MAKKYHDLSEELSQRYTMREPSKVRDFLCRHPFLMLLLLEAHEKVLAYFGAEARATLEIITDPEVEDDQELFVFVRTLLPPKEAFARLEQLDREWWLDASEEAQGKMCIHLRFA
jgi:hypothetical protein